MCDQINIFHKKKDKRVATIIITKRVKKEEPFFTEIDAPG